MGTSKATVATPTIRARPNDKIPIIVPFPWERPKRFGAHYSRRRALGVKVL